MLGQSEEGRVEGAACLAGLFQGHWTGNGQRRELFCLLASELRPSCICVQTSGVGGHFCEVESVSSAESGSKQWRGEQDLISLRSRLAKCGQESGLGSPGIRFLNRQHSDRRHLGDDSPQDIPGVTLLPAGLTTCTPVHTSSWIPLPHQPGDALYPSAG